MDENFGCKFSRKPLRKIIRPCELGFSNTGYVQA